eukprot:scaffold859_cov306-Pinguiococcus_pyrenoidosus.AAC.12
MTHQSEALLLHWGMNPSRINGGRADASSKPESTISLTEGQNSGLDVRPEERHMQHRWLGRRRMDAHFGRARQLPDAGLAHISHPAWVCGRRDVEPEPLSSLVQEGGRSEIHLDLEDVVHARSLVACPVGRLLDVHACQPLADVVREAQPGDRA